MIPQIISLILVITLWVMITIKKPMVTLIIIVWTYIVFELNRIYGYETRR